MRVRTVWEYRHLIWHLVSIELRMRYHGTLLGILWAMLNPLFMLIIFTFVFGHILKVPVENFHVFFFCGYLPWIFFANSFMTASFSIIKNHGLINKIYFPREVLIISEVVANTFNFCLQLIVLFAALFVFGVKINLVLIILYLPLLIIAEALFICGLSFYFATLNVFYRDVAQLMEVALMIWFYMTPIFYDLAIIPPEYRYMFTLNPMTHFIEGYRQIFLYAMTPAIKTMTGICASAIIAFITGYTSFIYYEMRFPEEV